MRGQTLLGSMAVAVALSAIGCLLVIPVAIQYYQITREYVDTAEVSANAYPVYRTDLKETVARSSSVKIIERDDSEGSSR